MYLCEAAIVASRIWVEQPRPPRTAQATGCAALLGLPLVEKGPAVGPDLTGFLSGPVPICMDRIEQCIYVRRPSWRPVFGWMEQPHPAGVLRLLGLPWSCAPLAPQFGSPRANTEAGRTRKHTAQQGGFVVPDLWLACIKVEIV